MSAITSYPLSWPASKPRARSRDHARFQTSFAKGRDNALAEIRRLGGSKVILSSDIPLTKDGLPFANLKPKSGDPGIAVYFTRKGKQLCFACDSYWTVDDNMQAIAKTIEALRGIARWGTGDMMEAAFTGFMALPAPAQKQWWDILGVSPEASLEQCRDAYRAKSIEHHPDQGGDHVRMVEVNAAWELCQQEKI